MKQSLERYKDSLFPYIFKLGKWQWPVTAGISILLAIVWLTLIFMPLQRNKKKYSALLSTTPLGYVSPNKSDEQQEQEVEYNARVVRNFEQMLQTSSQDWLGCLLTHAKRNEVQLIHYQPTSQALIDTQLSDYLICQATVECVGSYPQLLSFLAHLSLEYPAFNINLQSMSATAAGVQAAFSLRMLSVPLNKN